MVRRRTKSLWCRKCHRLFSVGEDEESSCDRCGSDAHPVELPNESKPRRRRNRRQTGAKGRKQRSEGRQSAPAKKKKARKESNRKLKGPKEQLKRGARSSAEIVAPLNRGRNIVTRDLGERGDSAKHRVCRQCRKNDAMPNSSLCYSCNNE